MSTVTPHIGQHQIVSELGTGHFGTVYLAYGETPRRGASALRKQHVAIKKLHDPHDQRARAGLVREFELLGMVRHRSVCRVYEYLETEGAVVMEYVFGANLRAVLDATARARETVFGEAAGQRG